MMKSKLCLSIATLALPFATVFGAASRYSLGIPGAPVICDTTDGSRNAWLSHNTAYPVMSVVTPGNPCEVPNAVSAVTIAGMPKVKMSAAEAGFVLERTKPEYYLCERLLPPGGVDWPATYERYLEDVANGDVPAHAFLFDPVGEAVYVAAGGTHPFNWKLTNGDVLESSYVIASSCQGRPRRIFWTDEPYNAPGIDLNGKFVKFFGSTIILTLTYGTATNTSPAGIAQEV